MSSSRGSFLIGIKPESPALAGGFLTSEPPGKPSFRCSNLVFFGQDSASE